MFLRTSMTTMRATRPSRAGGSARVVPRCVTARGRAERRLHPATCRPNGRSLRARWSGGPVHAPVDLGEEVVLPLDVREPRLVDVARPDLIVEAREPQEVLLRP